MQPQILMHTNSDHFSDESSKSLMNPTVIYGKTQKSFRITEK